MELWGITDCGKVRQDNQDVFKTLFDVEKGIAVLVVCDGMGGLSNGETASLLTASGLTRLVRSGASGLQRCLPKYIDEICEELLSLSASNPPLMIH